MSIKNRIKAIEKKLEPNFIDYAMFVPPILDKTTHPTRYIDISTQEVVSDKEVERLEEEFIKQNPHKPHFYVRILVDNTPLRDLDE